MAGRRGHKDRLAASGPAAPGEAGREPGPGPAREQSASGGPRPGLPPKGLQNLRDRLDHYTCLYRSLFNLAPVGIFQLDHNLKIIEANKAASELLEKNTAAQGRFFPDLVEASRRDLCGQHFESAHYYERWSSCDLMLSNSGGPERSVRIYSTSLVFSGEDRQGYLTVVVDLTRQMRTNAELDHASRKLKEANTVLNVLLETRKNELNELKERIAINQARLVFPVLEKLAHSGLDREQKLLLETLKSNLEQITSEYVPKLTSAAYGLTQREIEVANLIRNGLSSDEIADALNVTSSCVLFHRNRIRKKLGLVGKKKRLAAVLDELAQ